MDRASATRSFGTLDSNLCAANAAPQPMDSEGGWQSSFRRSDILFFSVFFFFFPSVFSKSVEVVLLVVTTIHTQGFVSTDLHRKSCYQEYGRI